MKWSVPEDQDLPVHGLLASFVQSMDDLLVMAVQVPDEGLFHSFAMWFRVGELDAEGTIPRTEGLTIPDPAGEGTNPRAEGLTIPEPDVEGVTALVEEGTVADPGVNGVTPPREKGMVPEPGIVGATVFAGGVTVPEPSVVGATILGEGVTIPEPSVEGTMGLVEGEMAPGAGFGRGVVAIAFDAGIGVIGTKGCFGWDQASE